MSRIYIKLKLILLSDAIFSSGESTPAGEDISLKTDPSGRPYLAGSTFKGLLSESVGNLLVWSGEDNAEARHTALFGEGGRILADDSRRIVFRSFYTDVDPDNPEAWSYLRAFTKMENGIAADKSLRLASCLREGLSFSGGLVCSEQDKDLITDGIRGIKYAGLLRNRGFGHVRLEIEDIRPIGTPAPVENSTLIHYVLTSEEPVSIPWLSRSGSGFGDTSNFTESRSYIPGSAVRGMVINALREQLPGDEFARIKKSLLTKTAFMNAFPIADGKTLIPTPSGFYADKLWSHKPYNILLEDVQPGDKRVSVGPFCHIDSSNTLHGAHIPMQTSLRIKRGAEKQVFTTRAIAAGTSFQGYIRLIDPSISAIVSKAFTETIWLGADKYSGNGLCHVSALDSKAPEYLRLSYSEGDSIPSKLVMLLMSDTVMKKAGEPVGIDCETLAKQLGVNKLTVSRCSTASEESSGFNRVWGAAAPVTAMYTPGSLFLLDCGEESPSLAAIRRLETMGLGANTINGCGSVLFLKDLASITVAPGSSHKQASCSPDVLRRRAEINWLLKERNNFALKKLSKSQLGELQARIEKVIAGGESFDQLMSWLGHCATKKGNSFKYNPIIEYMEKIRSSSTSELLGIECGPGSLNERLELICRLLNFSRKEARK